MKRSLTWMRVRHRIRYTQTQSLTKLSIESFLLFSQDIASNNLGMLNPRAPSVELSINDHEYIIHQSPALLSSHRAGGTTGAGRYGLRYTKTGARMIYTSSSMICPRNPQSQQTQARTTPYSAGHLPESDAQTRPRVEASNCPIR